MIVEEAVAAIAAKGEVEEEEAVVMIVAAVEGEAMGVMGEDLAIHRARIISAS